MHHVLTLFYTIRMPDSIPLPAAATIADAILAAPAVTRLGIACPSDRLRERAADDLAKDILARLTTDANQLPLAL